MGNSEEEQVKSMLDELGISSLDELEAETGNFRPIHETPVGRPVSASPEEEGQSPEGQLATEEPESEQSEDLSNEEILGQTLEVSVNPVSNSNNTRSTQHAELSVSALLHLMGLPTGSQITVLDRKLDLVITKLTTLQAKLDRINSQFEMLSATTSTERLEFQVSEIRSIMKKFFPQAFSGAGMQTSSSQLNTVKPKVVVQSSEPVGVSSGAVGRKETAIHVGVGPTQIEEDEPMSDEDYQVLEAQKLRNQALKDTK